MRQVVAPADLKSFSNLLLEVLFPIFAFSNFRVYSLDMLGKWYMACVGSVVIMIIGAVLGFLGAFLLCLRPPYSKILVLSTTFANCGALPYVLLPPIVLNWKRVSDAPEDALVEGYAVISLFAIVWTIALFFIGRPYALSMRPKEDLEITKAPLTPCGLLRSVDSVVWSALLGILLGCVAPARDFLSERAAGPLRFIGSYSYNLGRAAVPLSTMILGGSLYMGAKAQFSRAEEEEEKETGQLTRLALGACVIKLLLMPAMTIPLLLLALQQGALAPDQPMLFMVLMIQTAMPSAQTTLALLVAAGLQKQAGKMSDLRCIQSLLGPFRAS